MAKTKSISSKVLTTRIKLKYDILGDAETTIEENKGWVGHNPKLLVGEVAVVAVTLKDANAAPQILFKVGDGIHNFNDLPWATGLAADVYEWAKAENKPSYSADDINGLTEFVKNIPDIDTNTAHTHTAGEGLTIEGNGGISGNVKYAIDFNTVAKKSDIKDGKFTVTGGKGLTGSGYSTANQANTTEAELSVGQGNGIQVNTDSIEVKDYNNILTHKGGNTLQDEAGNTIIFNCGDSNF